jgi:hypothetical protein
MAALFGVAHLRADERVTVWGKSSPEYATWKFGTADKVKNESYVLSQGKFYGGTNRDRSLEEAKFLDVAKSLAPDLVGQHYYPADSAQKANLLITVDWGVTTVSESMYEQMGQDSPLGMADTDATRRDASHQNASNERATGRTTPSVQMLDQTYAMQRLSGLQSDANAQDLDRKSRDISNADNAVLVGFAETLRTEDQRGFDSAQGQMLRGFLADERYFVALTAYDCQEYLKSKKLVPVWTTRLSVRALDSNFRRSLALMSKAGGTEFGHKTEGVELKSPQIELGSPSVVSTDAK